MSEPTENEIIPTTEHWVSQRAEWIAKRDDILTAANLIEEVESDEDLSASGKVQTDLAKSRKALKDERLKITRQIDEVKKQFMEQEKDLGSPIEKELDRIKKLNDSFNTRKEMARQAELRRLAEEQRIREEAEARAQMEAEELFGGEVEVEPEPEPAYTPPPEKVKSENNRIVKRWSYDVREIGKVPGDFLDIRINDKAVRAYTSMCTATRKEPNVPGLVFTYTMSTESK